MSLTTHFITDAVCPKCGSQDWDWQMGDEFAVCGKRKCLDCAQIFFVANNPDISRWPMAGRKKDLNNVPSTLAGERT